MTGEDAVEKPQQLDPWFLSLLACPACPEHLALKYIEAEQLLVCGCGKYAFPIRDGIPILLVDEATLLDENASPANMTDQGA
jgi:uncharacterized protein YbaR (Trm112 family)